MVNDQDREPTQEPESDLAKIDELPPVRSFDLDFDMTRPKTLKQAFTIAQYLSSSGMFKDVRSVREAFGKIAIAIDLGLSPTQGLRSIHLIEGKPELGFDVIGSLMKSAGYSWTVEFNGNESVSLDFTDKDGKRLGLSEFSMDDAADAGLTNKSNWKKYPRNMLFARALSNGARWYAPEVFGGAVYAQGELSDTNDPPPELPTDQTEEHGSGEAPAPSDGAGQPATETGTKSPAEPVGGKTIPPPSSTPETGTTEPKQTPWHCKTHGPLFNEDVDVRGSGDVVCCKCGEFVTIPSKDDGPGEPVKDAAQGSSASKVRAEGSIPSAPVADAEPGSGPSNQGANWLEAVVSRETYVELRGKAADAGVDAAGFIDDPLAETDDADTAELRFNRWLNTAKEAKKKDARVEAAQDARNGA